MINFRAAWLSLPAVLFVLIATQEVAASPDLRGPLWANALCAAGMAAPIVAGHRRPALAALVTAAAAMAQTTWLTPSTRLAMPLVAMLLAAYTAGRRIERRAAAGAALLLCVAQAWLGPVVVNGDPLGDGLFVTVALWAVWLLGRSATTRARLADQELARQEAERRRAEQVRQAVADERRAVARDLHDTVAHAVTLMVLQATGTRLVAQAQPETAVAALATIERTGRQAMGDLRAMLGVLRTAGSDTAAPGPTLDDLEDLVRGARDSGMDVTVEDHTGRRALPRITSATAFRAVQEALTNAARHAPGAPVLVTLRAGRSGLRVTIDNEPGTAPATDVPGARLGLIGLRERVTALGGELRAVPRPGGGFTVGLDLPADLDPAGGPPAPSEPHAPSGPDSPGGPDSSGPDSSGPGSVGGLDSAVGPRLPGAAA
ncbi:sensor histidine kinase [Actinoplanes sp. NEAU-A12]|uniref:histidine kinase n=1 Tax=Actinoplanes sandaracinus TaxID=3045177 RepID=A0ABT6WI01_9ACTN|nr:sensor histidine kinase [Actinoplanes sandaracinus]MDI6099305.1 sensor histidine kinase [Actinoplanes sandaracinus]